MSTDRWRRRGADPRPPLWLASASVALFSSGLAIAQPPPTEIGLEALLAFAERHAPLLKVAESRRRRSEADRARASVWLRENPTLQLGVGPRSAAGTTDFDLIAAIEQPIEIGGQRGLRIEAAERESERRQVVLSGARWRLQVEIKRAFFEALVAEARMKAAEVTLALAVELGRVSERRLAAGDTSAIEARLAEAELIDAQSEVIGAEAALDSARSALAELSGWPTESLPMLKGDLADVAPPASILELTKRLEQHPEMSAERSARDAASADVAVADREAWPSAIIGVSAIKEGSAGGPASYILLGTLGVPLPLWDRNQGERVKAEVELDTAEIEIEATRTRLKARLRLAYGRLVSAERRVALYRRSSEPSTLGGIELLRRGLEAGELSIAEVTIAKSRFMQQARAELDARSAVQSARIELELAVGADPFAKETP